MGFSELVINVVGIAKGDGIIERNSISAQWNSLNL